MNKIVGFLREKHAESSVKATSINMLAAIPFTLFFSVISSLEANEDLLMNTLIWLLFYIGIDHFLSTRQERTNRIHSLKLGLTYLYQEKLGFILHLLAILGVLVLATELNETPENPTVLMVYDHFSSYSDIFLMLYLLTITARGLIRGAITFDNLSNFSLNLMMDVIAFTAAMMTVYTLIGTQGDAMYEFYINSKEEAVVALVTFAMLCIAFSLKKMMGSPTESIFGSGMMEAGSAHGSMQSGTAKPAYKMSNKSILHTAYHEAGHALFFACLKPYPINMEMVVRGDYEDYRLGYVTGLGQFELDPTKSMMEWSMLRYLAGDRANVLFNGESNAGAGSDHEKWIHRAQRYLEEQYIGTYYARPSNLLEQQSNNMLLNQLRDEQTELADRFLEENERVIEGIVGAILKVENKTLDRKALAQFMDQVVITDGIPVIKN